MALLNLTPAEYGLLREVRTADEDHGGLRSDELNSEETSTMTRLCDLALVVAVGEYGEAPDGEEDERDAGSPNVLYRITGGGVLVLADEP